MKAKALQAFDYVFPDKGQYLNNEDEKYMVCVQTIKHELEESIINHNKLSMICDALVDWSKGNYASDRDALLAIKEIL